MVDSTKKSETTGLDGPKKKAASAVQERLKKMETFFDQKEYVVIDHGTGYIKAGFSGEDLPRVIMPTVVGTREIQIDPSQQIGGAIPGQEAIQIKIEHAFGNAAFAQRLTLNKLSFPIQRGVIVKEVNNNVESFDTMQIMWNHIFTRELNLETKNMNILLTDSPQNTRENKQKIAEIMFEQYQVESLALMNTAVLSLFSTGKTSGIVVEVGEGVSYCVPIFEGYALPHATNKLDIGGQDITNELIRHLANDGLPVTEKHFEYVREIKEQMCEMALDFNSAMNSRDPLNEEQRSYELPDGGIIQVDHQKRYKATEILFQPQLMGSSVDGIAETTFKSIEKCDVDLKINLYNNIVLAGGTTMMPGFVERFDDEIRNVAEQSAKTDIYVCADLHRKYASWIGGSMFASFSTFQDMTIKKAEYEDAGENNKGSIVLKKTIY